MKLTACIITASFVAASTINDAANSLNALDSWLNEFHSELAYRISLQSLLPLWSSTTKNPSSDDLTPPNRQLVATEWNTRRTRDSSRSHRQFSDNSLDVSAINSSSSSLNNSVIVQLLRKRSDEKDCSGVGLAQADGCLCPLDRWGAQCEVQRPFSCTIQLTPPSQGAGDCLVVGTVYGPSTLLMPRLQCTATQKLSSIQLKFTVDCAQDEPLSLVNGDSASPFSYWIRSRDDRLILSKNPLISVQLKVWNFYDPSDDQQTAYSPTLSSSQLTGDNEPIMFTVNMTVLSGLRDGGAQVNYFSGNRIYIEAGLADLQPVEGLSRSAFTGLFIDFEN